MKTYKPDNWGYQIYLILHFQGPGTWPVQNLDFTRQTTDITHFAVVFHYDVISN